MSLVGLPGEDLVLAALQHVDLDTCLVHETLKGVLHTVLQNVEDILHVWMIFWDVEKPSLSASHGGLGDAFAGQVVVGGVVQIPEVLNPSRVHEEHQAPASEAVSQVERVELGPYLVEVKFVAGHNQEMIDHLVENLDGRSAILRQEKWY